LKKILSFLGNHLPSVIWWASTHDKDDVTTIVILILSFVTLLDSVKIFYVIVTHLLPFGWWIANEWMVRKLNIVMQNLKIMSSFSRPHVLFHCHWFFSEAMWPLPLTAPCSCQCNQRFHIKIRVIQNAPRFRSLLVLDWFYHYPFVSCCGFYQKSILIYIYWLVVFYYYNSLDLPHHNLKKINYNFELLKSLFYFKYINKFIKNKYFSINFWFSYFNFAFFKFHLKNATPLSKVELEFSIKKHNSIT